jgi:uncharacterized lipoprotein YbaY
MFSESRRCSSGVLALMVSRCSMSRPEQKAGPAPVRMTTPQSEASASFSASVSSSISSGHSALRFSGRFMVMVLTPLSYRSFSILDR